MTKLTTKQISSLFDMQDVQMRNTAKVNKLLAAAMLMLNAWDECDMPDNATRDRMAQALEEFGR